MYAIDWANTRGIAETTGCCFVPCSIVRCIIVVLLLIVVSYLCCYVLFFLLCSHRFFFCFLFFFCLVFPQAMIVLMFPCVLAFKAQFKFTHVR